MPLLAGCSSIDELKVKFGWKNNDFEYIKQGKIKKIIIQNTRDPGFRFIVTDKKAIEELYDILSSAKPADTKSELKPDYVFEMHEGMNKVYKFNYIAGLDKEDAGNLYSDDKVYLVSKRIDNDIIKSFWNIRKPRDFNKIYYGTLLNEIEKYSKDEGNGKSIGINLYDDLEAAKFILSTDLAEFENSLGLKVQKAEIIPPPIEGKEQKEYDVIATVKTVGYKTYLYKAELTFLDKKQNKEKKYYIIVSDQYRDGRWLTRVDTKKQNDF
jgi:hypothetical protein